jgi:hypothetical protein
VVLERRVGQGEEICQQLACHLTGHLGVRSSEAPTEVELPALIAVWELADDEHCVARWRLHVATGITHLDSDQRRSLRGAKLAAAQYANALPKQMVVSARGAGSPI